jgi:hypothetical protein
MGAVKSNVVGGVVAVQDAVATAGCISWWRLSGEVDQDKLAVAWKLAGLPEESLPPVPSDYRILRRVMKGYENKSTIVRTRKGDEREIALCRREEVDGKLIFREVLSAECAKTGGVTIASNESEEKTGAEIQASFNAQLSKLDSSDISNWLAKLVREVNAVSLRDMGGIYFIPYATVDRWQRIITAIRSVSGHFFAEVPALKSEEAVAAILDAITREAEAEAALLEEDLGTPDAVGERALKTRASRCAEVTEKVLAYEALLDVKLDALRGRLDGLKANLAAAALAAGGES